LKKYNKMPAPKKYQFNFKKYIELRKKFRLPPMKNRCLICGKTISSGKNICAKCKIKLK